MQRFVLPTILLVLFSTLVGAGSGAAPPAVRTLDGSGNNVSHPTWGQAGTQYSRIAAPNYADGIGRMVGGPSPRYVSNRIFNDVGQNLFSENDISQWGWAWGQFLDHDFGLRDETPAEVAPIAFDTHDPLEDVQRTTSARSALHPDSRRARERAARSPRQQINTIRSYIDASNVYGVTTARLDWLRDGPVDGNPTEQRARRCCCPGGYLPRADARGNAAAAPPMDLMGALAGDSGEGSRRRRRAGEREHRAHRDPDAVRPRAQPDRRAPARARLSDEAEVRDRPARRRRRGAVHHLQRVPPALGVQARAATAATTRASTPSLSNEFASSATGRTA